MNPPDLLPAERVWEIADNQYYLIGHSGDVRQAAIRAINAAAPEIARAVLEAAARRLNAKAAENRQEAQRIRNTVKAATDADDRADARAQAREQDAAMLRQMAKEIKP